jgi:hypothetical protein
VSRSDVDILNINIPWIYGNILKVPLKCEYSLQMVAITIASSLWEMAIDMEFEFNGDFTNHHGDFMGL